MAAKKTAAKKSAGAATGKVPTKSQLMMSIAEDTGLSRKQVASVFEALGEQVKKKPARAKNVVARRNVVRKAAPAKKPTRRKATAPTR